MFTSSSAPAGAHLITSPLIASYPQENQASAPIKESERTIANKPCRLGLDNATSIIITLPDGHRIGYAQYSSPTGRTVVYMDGLPCSWLKGTYLDDIRMELDACIIALDCPSYEQSSPHPARTLLDQIADVKLLLNPLNLWEYSVIWSDSQPKPVKCARN